MSDSGLLIATEFSRRGFGIGPIVDRLMADLVTGLAPSVDPATLQGITLHRWLVSTAGDWTIGCRRGQPPGSQGNA